MAESSWSDPQSTLTTELGFVDVRDVEDASENVVAPRQRRCEVPNLRPRQRKSSDQQVPVCWDQTVPVWSHKEASSTISGTISSSRERHGKGSRSRFGGGNGRSGGTMFLRSSLKRTYRCEDGLTKPSAASGVSFEDIMAMYQSSLVEITWSETWLSPGDWRVMGALVVNRSRRSRRSTGHGDTRRRLWPCAGNSSNGTTSNSSSGNGHISVLLCCS